MKSWQETMREKIVMTRPRVKAIELYENQIPEEVRGDNTRAVLVFISGESKQRRAKIDSRNPGKRKP